MATKVKSGTLGSGSPLLAYELYAEQTAGSGNNRTIKVTAKFKVNGSTSASHFSYDCTWKPIIKIGTTTINGTETSIKGSEKWTAENDYRSFSYTFKNIDVGTTSSKSIVVGFTTDSTGSNGWDGTESGNFTVTSTNTAPYWNNGTLTAQYKIGSSGELVSVGSNNRFPETATYTKLTWSKATDDKSETTLTYVLKCQVNDGAWSTIYSGNNKTYTHSIGAGNEGSMYDYAVAVYDSEGLKAENSLNMTAITKNKLTASTLSLTGNIGYSEGNETISYSYSGGSNTDGSGIKSRVLTCSGITVYNGTLTSASGKITIYKSGAVPTTPYIKFADIQKKYENAAYKGTLTFTLKTTNNYGTSKTTTKSVSVNLQVAPTAASNLVICEDENSTAYKKVESIGNSYFIPDGNDIVRVTWDEGLGKLDEPIKYALYVAYDFGTYEKIADLSGGISYYDHKIPKQNTSKQFKYLIRTICQYNTSLYSDSYSSAAKTLHYYNVPTLIANNVVRNADSSEITFRIKSNTSLQNVKSVYSWNVSGSNNFTASSNGDIESLQTMLNNVKISGLTDDGKYVLNINFKDSTGFSTITSTNINIGPNSPLLFVNKYGVGINGQRADESHSLALKGNVKIKAPNNDKAATFIKTFDNDTNESVDIAIGSGGTTAIGSGASAAKLIEESGNHFYDSKAANTIVSSENGTYVVTGCGDIKEKKISAFTETGSLFVNDSIYEGATLLEDGTFSTKNAARVYSPNNKPLPTDIGALGLDGGLVDGTVTLTAGNFIKCNSMTGATVIGVGINDSNNACVFPGFNGNVFVGSSESAMNVRGKSISLLGETTCNNTLTAKVLKSETTLHATGNVYLGEGTNTERSINLECKGATSGTTGRAAHSARIYGASSTSTTSIGIYDVYNNSTVFVYQDGNSTSGNKTGSKKLVVNSGITFSATGTVSTSDERLKSDFKDLSRYEDFFYKVQPISFKYNNGNSGRDWIGVSAQQVEKSLNEVGLDNKDFAGLVINHKSKNDDDWQGITDEYGIRYEQFILLNTHMIQKQHEYFLKEKDSNATDHGKFIKDIEKLNSNFDSYKKEISNLSYENKLLSERCDSYKKDIENLNYETKMLGERCDSYKKDIADLAYEIKLLREAKK